MRALAITLVLVGAPGCTLLFGDPRDSGSDSDGAIFSDGGEQFDAALPNDLAAADSAMTNDLAGGCQMPLTLCGDTCVDERSNVDNCGGCGNKCADLAHGTRGCANNVCIVAACDTGFRDCDGAVNNGCEVDITSDGNNCGACGNVCANGQMCAAGKCTITCTMPEVACNMTCIDVRSDPDNCGACGMACANVANGTRACANSMCTVGGCNAGFANCDGVVANGCEINLATDGNNCGACGKMCTNGQVCTNSLCAQSCMQPQMACGNVCVDPRSDVANCGGCGKVCPNVANGVPACANSLCGIGSCNGSFRDCNAQAQDGCEIDTASSVANCGGCGKACAAVANGTPGCMGGACAIGSCNAGFGDCDGASGNGCEVNLNSNVMNCGMCGKFCPAVTNGTPGCMGGMCAIGSCNANFGDCDGVVGNGCEANLLGDAKNCGKCGMACGNNQSCMNGGCVNNPMPDMATAPPDMVMTPDMVMGGPDFGGQQCNPQVGIDPCAPWPLHRRTINRIGRSPYVGAQSNKMKWKVTTGKAIYSSAAIGTDGTIYVGSLDNNLYAIDQNGNTKWTFPTAGGVESPPAIGNNAIYFGSYDKNLYAIDFNGNMKWKYPTGDFVSGSAAIASDGTIYAPSLDGSVYALDPAGNKKWSFMTGDRVYSSPSIDGNGTIYFGSADHSLYAVNPNGTSKWSYPTGGEVYTSPAIGNGVIYFGSLDNAVYAVDVNGQMKWLYVTGNSVDSSPALDVDGSVYFASGDKNIYALDSTGHLKWKYPTGDVNTFSSVAIGADSTIYVGSWDHNLYALTNGGALKWKFTTTGVVFSSPTIGADGTIYIGSWDKNFYAIGP
jgi:outer membrane protein assembly factor BamB